MSDTGAGAGGSKGYFTEGRGRGFDIPERKELPATNAERTKALPIDIDDLDKPGVGPVNFDKFPGRVKPDTTGMLGSEGDESAD